MIAKIHVPLPKAKRIKFYLPYKAKAWRDQVKRLNSSWYHFDQKLWSVVNTPENLELLKSIFKADYEMYNPDGKVAIPTKKLSSKSDTILEEIEKKLILKSYSRNTLRTYRINIIPFLTYFEDHNLEDLTKDQIEGFIYKLKSKNRISDNKQNLMINAIHTIYILKCRINILN